MVTVCDFSASATCYAYSQAVKFGQERKFTWCAKVGFRLVSGVQTIQVIEADFASAMEVHHTLT
jgi:hypothetical protein